MGIEDGVERWVAAHGKAFFDAAGHCERFIGTTLDITEAKRAEHAAARRSEQMRQLADTSARLNTTLDVPSVLGVITAEARKLIGARHAVTTAATVGSLAPGVQPLTVASHAEDAMTPDSSGGPVQSAALSVPLIGHGGARIGVIELTSKDAGGFHPDDAAVITQLSQIAARAIENARLYEALRANDKRKDEFLAMLAHELRNPLAAMRNAVALGSDTTDHRRHLLGDGSHPAADPATGPHDRRPARREPHHARHDSVAQGDARRGEHVPARGRIR